MAHCNCPSQSPIPPPQSWFSESSPSQALQCHRALQYPDILHAVFDHLDPRQCREDRRVCASAALVCRSFSEFASRALWRKMSDLHYLWRVLLIEDLPFGRSREGPVFQSVRASIFTIKLHGNDMCICVDSTNEGLPGSNQMGSIPCMCNQDSEPC